MTQGAFIASSTSLNTDLSNGNVDRAYNWLTKNYGKLSASQKQEVQNLLAQYGISY